MRNGLRLRQNTGFRLTGCDAWKLIRVPFRDTAADTALRPARWAGRSQEKFWAPISTQSCNANTLAKLLKIGSYTFIAWLGQHWDFG